MIGHTVHAFAINVAELQPTVPVDGVTNLCEMTADDVSFVRNLEYTSVDAATCATLSDATQFYRVANDPVVTDLAGLELERDLAWVDVVEVIVWLLVILTIELAVHMQSRGVTGGMLLSTARFFKLFFYIAILGMGVYWATLSHWVCLWDEIVWIGGFIAIEMNVSQWRNESLRGRRAARRTTSSGNARVSHDQRTL